jgi:hypothetical protein
MGNKPPALRVAKTREITLKPGDMGEHEKRLAQARQLPGRAMESAHGTFQQLE